MASRDRELNNGIQARLDSSQDLIDSEAMQLRVFTITTSRHAAAACT